MGIRPNIVFEDVKPKLDGGFKNIGLIDPVVNLYNAPFVGAPQVPPVLSKGDSWMEFSLSLSIMDMIGKNNIENYNNLLKDVNKITRAMVALVKIMRILSSDLKSINRALKFVIKQIAITLKDLIESFMSTGMYYTVLRPKQSENDTGYIVPTWGDFDEFKTVIINACTDYNDKGSPSQLSLDAQVGGFVIGGVTGSNNPQAIDYIYHNMGVLANLFNFKPSLPGPPKNAVALAGIYNEKPGIKLTWSRSDSFIIGGFYIYRTEIKGGSFLTENQMKTVVENSPLAKDPNQVINFQKIKIFDNSKSFNKSTENPVFIKYSPFIDKYSYVDADIENGKRYYYKVYTVIQKSGDGLTANPYLFRVDSPLASNEASAVSYSCIPISEITKGILTLDGNWVDEKVHAKSKWESVSLKSLLGSQIDKLLRNVESFADKLIGYVSTSTDAVNEYLNFFSNKISDYIKIIQIITQVVNILMNFRLKGSVLLLNLTDVKKGGIQGFCERVAKAPVNSAILGKMPRSEKEIINGPTTGTVINERMSNDMGQSLAQLKGIYYGLVVVYGVGDPSNYKAYSAPYMEEYNDVVRQLNDSQRSINMLLKILLGKG